MNCAINHNHSGKSWWVHSLTHKYFAMTPNDLMSERDNVQLTEPETLWFTTQPMEHIKKTAHRICIAGRLYTAFRYHIKDQRVIYRSFISYFIVLHKWVVHFIQKSWMVIGWWIWVQITSSMYSEFDLTWISSSRSSWLLVKALSSISDSPSPSFSLWCTETKVFQGNNNNTLQTRSETLGGVQV